MPGYTLESLSSHNPSTAVQAVAAAAVPAAALVTAAAPAPTVSPMSLPSASELASLPGTQSATTAPAAAAAATPWKDKEVRFQANEIVAASAMINRNNRLAEAKLKSSNTAKNFGEADSLEARVFGLDIMRAGAEDDYDIAYMRVVSFIDGKILTGQQVFPRLTTKNKNGDFTEYVYKKFILQAYSINKVERAQILKSNKALHVYFFNNSPEVISMQGILKASEVDPWDQAMIIAWDKLLRGTELARHRAILEIGIAGTTYWGYPLSFSYSLNANMQNLASYSMQMVIVDSIISNDTIDADVLHLQGPITNTNSMVTNDLTVGPNDPARKPVVAETASATAYWAAQDAKEAAALTGAIRDTNYSSLVPTLTAAGGAGASIGNAGGSLLASNSTGGLLTPPASPFR